VCPGFAFTRSHPAEESRSLPHPMSEKGRGEAGDSGQRDIMGTGSDWAPHSRHTGMAGGGGRQVAAAAVGGAGGSGPTCRSPARSRDARGPGLGTGGCPQEARVLTKRTG